MHIMSVALTKIGGITREGFRHILTMLQEKEKIVFLSLLGMGPLFLAVKFAYLLDRLFQNFIDKLGNFYEAEDPDLMSTPPSLNLQLSTFHIAC
jgi:hypothetical protein